MFLYLFIYLSLFLCKFLDDCHNRITNTCQYCRKKYSSKRGLDRHMKYECDIISPKVKFKCPYCMHSSKRKDNLKQHMYKHRQHGNNVIIPAQPYV